MLKYWKETTTYASIFFSFSYSYVDLSRKSSLVNVRLTPSICPGVLLFIAKTGSGVALPLEMPVHLFGVNFVSVRWQPVKTFELVLVIFFYN